MQPGARIEGMHPITLGFANGDLERAWWRHVATERGGLIRGAIALLLVVMTTFGLVDAVAFPEATADLLKIRAVTLALLALPVPWVFGRGSEDVLARHAQHVLLYLALVAFGAMFPMGLVIARTPTDERLFATALTMLFSMSALYGVSGLRFAYAAPVGLLFTVIYFGLLGQFAGTNGLFYATALVFGAAGNVVGLGVCWSLEAYGRRAFLRELELAREQKRSETLLLNIVPRTLAARLQGRPGTCVDRLPSATVLFATVVGFDAATRDRSPLETVALLDRIVARLDKLARQHGVERIKTIGATWMGAAGVPEPVDDHAERAAVLALAMRDAVRDLARETGLALALRVGICSGPVVTGVIGRTRFAFDCWGDTTNTAARLDTHGEPDRLQAAATTVALLGERFRVDARGVVQVKGKGPLQTWWIEGAA